ncbi:MAG TPA: caspase family protein [Thermoplasmatales archaeon]|nr:caspase family protein [Thermoplasmatales archaeon]
MLDAKWLFRVILPVGILIFPIISWSVESEYETPVYREVEYHAVLIGINAYPGSYLPYSVNEIQNFKQTLLKCGNWFQSNIKVLIDGNATKQGVQESIEWLAENADEDDVSLIYFVGHGGRDLNGEFIVTYDGEIHDAELAEYISGVQGVVVVVIDACNSGGFIDELKGKNRVVLTACRGNERTYQVKELKSGIFGFFLNMSLSWFTKRVETTYMLTKMLSIYYSRSLGNNSEYVIHPQIYDGTIGFTKIINHHPYMDKIFTPSFLYVSQAKRDRVLWRMEGGV